jgi:hypothetical protein
MFYINRLLAKYQLLIATGITEINMVPTQQEWWIDILRVCYWGILRGLLFIVDILYDVVIYIATLDFLSATPVGEFYDKYKVFLIIFLTFAFMIVGIMVMSADNNMMQKSKVKSVLYGVILIIIFSTIYPILNEFSIGMNKVIGIDVETISVRVVQNSTKINTYNPNGTYIQRDITIQEAKDLLGNLSLILDSENTGWTIFSANAYKYDIAWTELTILSIVLIFGIYLLGYNATRIVIDIGFMKVLSIFALPFTLVNDGARKKFILETFKNFATLPLSFYSLAFFLLAVDWLMNLNILGSGILNKYANTWVSTIVIGIYYFITIPAAASICLDGSNKIVGIFGIDVGVKSATGSFATMKSLQMGANAAKNTVNRGAKKVAGAISGAAGVGASAAGASQGVSNALNDMNGKQQDSKNNGKGTSESSNKNQSPNSNTSTTNDAINIPKPQFKTKSKANEETTTNDQKHKNNTENKSPNNTAANMTDVHSADDNNIPKPQFKAPPINADTLEESSNNSNENTITKENNNINDTSINENNNKSNTVFSKDDITPSSQQENKKTSKTTTNDQKQNNLPKNNKVNSINKIKNKYEAGKITGYNTAKKVQKIIKKNGSDEK